MSRSEDFQMSAITLTLAPSGLFEGSGHRLASALGAPPSSREMRWYLVESKTGAQCVCASPLPGPSSLCLLRRPRLTTSTRPDSSWTEHDAPAGDGADGAGGRRANIPGRSTSAAGPHIREALALFDHLADRRITTCGLHGDDRRDDGLSGAAVRAAAVIGYLAVSRWARSRCPAPRPRSGRG